MTDLKALSVPPPEYDPCALPLPPLEIGPTLDQWRVQREALREKWLEYLGHGPEAPPPEPEVHDEEDLGEITRSLVSYQVEEGCRVEAYLIRPKGAGPFPGVVVYHPTTNDTILQPAGLAPPPFTSSKRTSWPSDVRRRTDRKAVSGGGVFMPRSRWSAFAFGLLMCVAAYAQDFPLIREMKVDGQTIIIDNTNTRLRVEVLDEFIDQPRQADLARKPFKSYADAAAAAGRKYVLPSAALLHAKGKKLDDGMYAAVDLAAEGDFGKLKMGKREFCQRVLEALEKRHGSLSGYAQQACEVAISYVASALKAGGQLEGRALRGVTLYRDVGRKPISFYTWSQELEAIFRRDTALQKRLGLDLAPQVFREGQLDERLLVAAGAVLADVVTSDPDLVAEYDRHNALYARLTNPLNGMSAAEVVAAVKAHDGLEAAIADEQKAQALAMELGELGKPGLALFQPSRSKAMHLLWLAAAAGASSMDEFIKAVRDGRIDLRPDDESGWYEYQQYALEPLLIPDKMPEGDKVDFGEKYRKLLEEAFKSMMTQVRETHAKVIEVPPEDEPPRLELEVEIVPYLAVEPLASTYRRFADAYDFLRSALLDHLGPEALTALHVLDEGGVEREPPLGDELDGVMSLMHGAYLLTCRDIGIEPELGSSSEDLMPTLTETDTWLQRWTEDPDMERDVRMMIQVSSSPDVFWAVIGVKITVIEVTFEEPPEVRASEPSVELDLRFGSQYYWVPTEKFIEVQFEGDPLNREEFRALCDHHKTEAKIMRALKGQGAVPAPRAQVARRGLAALQWILPTVFVIVGLALVIPQLIKALRRARG